MKSSPEYLPELARLKAAMARAADRQRIIPDPVRRFTVNPTLELFELGWQGLAALAGPEFQGNADQADLPAPGQEWVLCYRGPRTGKIRIRVAGALDLLALKLVAEGRDLRQVAAEEKLTIGRLTMVLERAVELGLILSPASLIHRGQDRRGAGAESSTIDPVSVFTLQWHLTQACDLRCRHCYDRSRRAEASLDQALRVLDDFFDFCWDRHVQGQVTFTGGNPFLHPQFTDIYRAASERGLATAILGNPVARTRVEEIAAIRAPEFYQVSLEGLADHNDYIRGTGHFARTMDFLATLKELGIYSMVMLTLTRDNLDQVLPLARLLAGRADLFTFNRLAMVGEGARLAPVEPAAYPAFLAEYLQEEEENPGLQAKDNLFNILRYGRGQELTGGCAGFGCAAAFSFLALLPDGEVHACRKFPSPIGNVSSESFATIYGSALARGYRQGPEACRGCAIRPRCGGCLAVAHGFGLDVFTDRDPYCFMDTMHENRLHPFRS